MDEQSNARFARIEATLEELALADRRLQDRQRELQEAQRRLDARTEALVHGVELLSAMHRDHEATMKDTINRLANIVISHDERLDDLENR